MNAAVPNAALLSAEFIDGLDLQMGGDVANPVWRGDPRTLVIIAHILVMSRLFEDMLRKRDNKITDAHAPFGWWYEGLAGLETATIERYLIGVDLSEAEALYGPSRGIEGLPQVVDPKVGDNTMPRHIGRWRKWIEWPLGMVRKS